MLHKLTSPVAVFSGCFYITKNDILKITYEKKSLELKVLCKMFPFNIHEHIAIHFP